MVPKSQSLLDRQNKKFSVGLLSCSKFHNSSIESQIDFGYQVAKKHSAPKADRTFKCNFCYQEFPGFYILSQQKDTQHGFPIKTASIDPDDIINEVDDMNFNEELRSSQHFLVDCELEHARHKLFIYANENLNATMVDTKFHHLFKT